MQAVELGFEGLGETELGDGNLVDRREELLGNFRKEAA